MVDSFSCEGEITKEECWLAIKHMKDGKSAGCDGLPVEFYKSFFPIIGDAYVQYVNACFRDGKFCPSQRMATITLLCKNPEKPEFLSNWRPISLLNVDYKIVSKVLCNRLKHVVSNIVQLNQTCVIPGRSISDNLHLLRNVLDYADQKDMKVILLSLDQMKAFDNVSHEFLFKALEKYGFGPDFQHWIKMMYTDVRSQVLVNGFISESFAVTKGVRQGCSISPLLFVLVVEALAVSLRENSKVSGIPIPGCKDVVKISQYADDMNVFVPDTRSIYECLKMVKAFGNASGLCLNLEKSW